MQESYPDEGVVADGSVYVRVLWVSCQTLQFFLAVPLGQRQNAPADDQHDRIGKERKRVPEGKGTGGGAVEHG